MSKKSMYTWKSSLFRSSLAKFLICLLLSSSLVMLTSSCAVWSWFMGGISDDEVKELDDGLNVERRKTPFDDSFRELGLLIQAYGINPAPIQCKNIGNETAEKGLPSDLYVMISTCVNKIGKQIVFIPYDVQYVVNESVTGGKIERVFPVSVITGGITGFDKDLIEKERKGEIDAAWAGAQVSGKYNAGESVAKISLDLNIMDYKTQAYYPQVQASNSINLRKDKLGWSVAAYYMGSGGEFESDVKTQQGVHMALRMLAEFSTIELLGKYFKVPYWKCIKGNPDENMLKYMQDYYNDMPQQQQILEVKRLLFLHGYKNIDRNSDTMNDIETDALSKASRQFAANGIADALFKLWKNVNPKVSINYVLQDRKRKIVEEQNMATERQRAAKIAAQQEAEKNARGAEEFAKKQEQFKTIVLNGDKLLSEKKIPKAVEQYRKALEIFPTADYPKEKLKLIEDMAAAGKKADDAYAGFMSAGDSFFKKGDYAKAKAEYIKASKVKPGDGTAAKKIEEADKVLSIKKPAGIGSINEKDFNND